MMQQRLRIIRQVRPRKVATTGRLNLLSLCWVSVFCAKLWDVVPSTTEGEKYCFRHSIRNNLNFGAYTVSMLSMGNTHWQDFEKWFGQHLQGNRMRMSHHLVSYYLCGFGSFLYCLEQGCVLSLILFNISTELILANFMILGTHQSEVQILPILQQRPSLWLRQKTVNKNKWVQKQVGEECKKRPKTMVVSKQDDIQVN